MMQSLFDLKNKTVLITGASSGIGKSAAIVCSRLGADCILVGRNEARLEETFKNLNDGNHCWFALDITNYSDLKSLVEDAVSKTNRISGFIHASGIEVSFPLEDTKLDSYEKIFAVNVVAGFELAKHIIKKKNFNADGGSLVFISSVMGSVGSPKKSAYCSSKGAITGGVKAMALELASRRIRVNSISPAMVNTGAGKVLLAKINNEEKNEIMKLHPLGIGKPDDVAFSCAFLLSDSAKLITGIDLKVDGGYTAR
jgi:NAD(P)-dependent dehydrogenase (short-subunit alcohol dehydrogenase family)